MLTPLDAKRALRRTVRERLEQLSPESRRVGSERVCAKVEAELAWSRASTVLLFVPVGTEIDVAPLLSAGLAAGKSVCLPSYEPQRDAFVPRRILSVSTDLVEGYRGIPEPRGTLPEVPLEALDFLIIPGLAFDLEGRRLGRGKGHYDRLLAFARGVTCGVGYDEQIVPDVPVESHDVKLNMVLSPSHTSGRVLASHKE